MEIAKIRNYFRKVYEKEKLDLPCTPSKWIPNLVHYENVTIVHLSYGGGMGGTSCNIVCKEISYDEFKRGMIEVTLLTGETKLLNPRFIVSVDNNNKVAHTYLDCENRNALAVGICRLNFLIPRENEIKEFGNQYDNKLSDYI